MLYFCYVAQTTKEACRPRQEFTPPLQRTTPLLTQDGVGDVYQYSTRTPLSKVLRVPIRVS